MPKPFWIHRVQRYQALAEVASSSPRSSTMPLPDLGRVQELVKAPARDPEPDTAEAEKLKSLSSTASDLESRVPLDPRQFRQPPGRLDAYVRQDFWVRQPYVRVNGEVVDPAVSRTSQCDARPRGPASFPASWMPWQAPTSGPSSQLTTVLLDGTKGRLLQRAGAVRGVRRRDALVADRRRRGVSPRFPGIQRHAHVDRRDPLLRRGVDGFTINHTFTEQVQRLRLLRATGYRLRPHPVATDSEAAGGYLTLRFGHGRRTRADAGCCAAPSIVNRQSLKSKSSTRSHPASGSGTAT